MAITSHILRLTFERGTLLLDTSQPASLETIDIPLKQDGRVSLWRCDPFYYKRLLEELHDYQVADNVPRWQDVTWKEIDLPDLRQEQQEACEKWLDSKQGVVVMPTGTGKTEVALSLMRELAVSTLVVAPVRDLMYQWHRRIMQGLGYDAGIIGDNVYRVKPVSVITYDSACIHMDKLGNLFKLIVFDECHHLPGTMRREAALMSAAPYRLGLTATPQRADDRHKDLDTLIGPTVYKLTIGAVRGKTLAEYETVRIPVYLLPEEQELYDSCSRQVREYMARRNTDDGGKKSSNFTMQDLMAEIGSDPEARAVQRAYYKMKSIEDRAAEKFRILEDIFRLHLGERVIVFTGSNVMARDISTRFLIPCLLSHCLKEERIEILDGFREGMYPAIVANRVLDEGVDIPGAKVAVVLGGMSSKRQAVQRLGRILRKSGNKEGILYEVVCGDTGEDKRSRKRRSTDAYKGTRHRRL